jgi:three-Cys-motif partner protein
MEPHTRAKHVVLRRYLQAWLPVMSALVARQSIDQRGRLVIVDGFAGPGRYAGGEEGSPIIALKAFLEHAYKDVIRAELVYVFIEEHRGRCEHLRREVETLDPPAQVKWDVIEGRYEDVFQEALDSVQGSPGRLAPTFAFIDPFGYAEMSMNLTERLLNFERCEALIYMPLPFVARFIGRPGQEDAMDNLFGTPRWREAIPLRGELRRKFLHDLFRDQLLTEQRDRMVRSFEVPTARGNGYHLFFTTGHEKGLEAMKDAMWAADPLGGERFRDTTESDQLVIFSEQVDTGPLLGALRTNFGTKPFSIEQATSFALRKTPYKKGHLKKLTLVPAEKAGQLEVLTSRKRRYTFPDATSMRFVGQTG